MPIYEYKCEKCNLLFDELVKPNAEALTAPCPQCKGTSEKQVSKFSSVIAGGSSNEPVDMQIGREAEKRWQHHFDKQGKRRKGQELKEIKLPQDKDGKYMPVMALGGAGEKSKRSEYVGALKEHRRKRKEQGQSQFNEPGEF